MKNLLKILLFLLTLFTSCEDGDKKIFWISPPNSKENDFLFMAESTNIAEIESDSLTYYLTKEEMTSAEKLTFRSFGTIQKNKKFNVCILLKEGSGSGRDYTFIIRTFDKNFKIIDSYELASWIDFENRYCYGSINNDLIIKRTCEEGKDKDVRQIVNDGRIIATSYHGRD